MKLENEFSVAASIEDTWGTLLDIERVATCLPGATIEPGDEDGVYHGAMKMKLGPMNVQYKGTAKLQDVDEDTHTASIAVQAREAKGQGTAAAVISNHLEQVNGKHPRRGHHRPQDHRPPGPIRPRDHGGRRDLDDEAVRNALGGGNPERRRQGREGGRVGEIPGLRPDLPPGHVPQQRRRPRRDRGGR